MRAIEEETHIRQQSERAGVKGHYVGAAGSARVERLEATAAAGQVPDLDHPVV
jgi:hypothetical protein